MNEANSSAKPGLTLEELVSIQPGTARLMAELTPRISHCYHAAAAENWDFARYMLGSAIKLMRTIFVMRPKYTEDMQHFIAEDCLPVLEAIQKQDWASFEVCFKTMVDRANHYHEAYNKHYIKYKVPENAPDHLDLTP